MKCSHCGNDAKKTERADGKCPKCHRPFVFDPANRDPLTDMGFQHAIDHVSSNGTVFFAERHLLRHLARVLGKGEARNQRAAALVFGGVVVLITFMMGIGIHILLLAVAAAELALVAVIYGLIQDGPAADYVVQNLYTRWKKVNGDPAKLALPPPAAPARKLSHDELVAYSFDRAVICDQRDIVDVLLANRFHFENNCAVLSADGHPAAAFETVRKMLRNNPRIEVFVLHDASPDGCALAWKLRNDPAWFQGIGRVVDVGLRPAHAKLFPGGVVDITRDVAPDPGIKPDERAWLAKHELELAVVRPEQLIKRLYRAIVKHEEQAFEPDAIASDPLLLGSDTSVVDGGADSFG
jgi:hypothetical protein